MCKHGNRILLGSPAAVHAHQTAPRPVGDPRPPHDGRHERCKAPAALHCIHSRLPEGGVAARDLPQVPADQQPRQLPARPRHGIDQVRQQGVAGILCGKLPAEHLCASDAGAEQPVGLAQERIPVAKRLGGEIPHGLFDLGGPGPVRQAGRAGRNNIAHVAPHPRAVVAARKLCGKPPACGSRLPVHALLVRPEHELGRPGHLEAIRCAFFEHPAQRVDGRAGHGLEPSQLRRPPQDNGRRCAPLAGVGGIEHPTQHGDDAPVRGGLFTGRSPPHWAPVNAIPLVVEPRGVD